MAMMKNLKLIISSGLLVLFSVACQATQQAMLSMEVTNPVEITSRLGIDNVYRMLEFSDKQYYAGFRIDAQGVNYPLLIELDSADDTRRSWEFEDIIADIFIYNSAISLLFDSGESLSLTRGKWVKNSLKLSPASVVVFSDGKLRLIACSPAALSLSNPYQGGCESVNPDWKALFSWQEIVPKFCGDYLIAVTWSQQQSKRLTIDPATGEIIQQQPFTGNNICKP